MRCSPFVVTVIVKSGRLQSRNPPFNGLRCSKHGCAGGTEDQADDSIQQRG
jgi:hypothetical protein